MFVYSESIGDKDVNNSISLTKIINKRQVEERGVADNASGQISNSKEGSSTMPLPPP
jgi:hypothetical protein